MIPTFPKPIANKGISAYFTSLVLVSLIYYRHIMGIEYILLGIMWVSGFFLLSANCSAKWERIDSKTFAKNVFFVALALRVAWMLFSYFFYKAKTGVPFEPGAADSMGYHDLACYLSQESWQFAFRYWGNLVGVSDTGYAFWLTLLYKIFGPSIITARFVKSVLSAVTCLLIYKLSSRSFGEQVGRMAALFSVFMPNLIIYCGLHLKETEMIFLIVAFLDRSDYLIRTRHYNVVTIALPLLLGLSLFFFRTVLGAVAFVSLFAGLVFTSAKLIGRKKRIMLICLGVLAVLTFAGGTIATEVEGYWETGTENQDKKIEYRTIRGAKWAKYAVGGVLAPMEFFMPMSTMIDTGQDNQMILHGGNFIKNFMGIFVLIALVALIFREKNIRDVSLIVSFLVGYLGVIALSGYGNAERFLLPAVPCLLMLTAYGISRLNIKNIKWVKYWYVVVVVMEVSWAFFKLGSRGLIM